MYWEDLVKLKNKKTGEIKLFISRSSAVSWKDKQMNSENWRD